MEEKKERLSGQSPDSGGRTSLNTGRTDTQRREDLTVKGDKGSQQQGNHGSRQGDGGNRGSRGNRGLG